MNNTVPIERDIDAFKALRSPWLTPRAPEEPRRHLRLADAPARKARRNPIAGALVATVIVLTILAAQLGLSILISEGAYETRALELEQRDLLRVERVLQQNVEKLASPQNLVDSAAQLGMVQNSHPASLRLSDSAVLGSLESTTTAVTDNVVPNDTLTALPVVAADGLLVPRGGQAAADAELAAQAPVPWKGELPAPSTR